MFRTKFHSLQSSGSQSIPGLQNLSHIHMRVSINRFTPKSSICRWGFPLLNIHLGVSPWLWKPQYKLHPHSKHLKTLGLVAPNPPWDPSSHMGFVPYNGSLKPTVFVQMGEKTTKTPIPKLMLTITIVLTTTHILIYYFYNQIHSCLKMRFWYILVSPKWRSSRVLMGK